MEQNIDSNNFQLYNQINKLDFANVDNLKNISLNIIRDNGLNNENFLHLDFIEFLNTNFTLSAKSEDIINFLGEYPNLLNVLYIIPNLFNNEFPNDSLEIKFTSSSYEDIKLGVLVHTNIDGFKASKKIELIEDNIYNNFGNVFENFFISAEFIR